MSPLLTLRIALRALARNKLRTALTMLGIIIGVAAVVAMLSIGAGAQEAVKSNLSALGVNTIEVSPGFRRGRHRGVSGNEKKLSVSDWKALSVLSEVKASFPMVSASSQLVYGSSNWSSSIRGTTNEFFEIQD